MTFICITKILHVDIYYNMYNNVHINKTKQMALYKKHYIKRLPVTGGHIENHDGHYISMVC